MAIPWDDIASFVIAVICTVAVLVGGWAIWWVWWMLPKQQVAQLTLKIRDPKARADVEDNFRKTVGQALGGAAVLIGVLAAYLQFSGRQQLAYEQLYQSQRASSDLLISNQVAKSFEQLGSDKLATRLGGIYGLEGVMNTSPEYGQQVLEALCAFVREGAGNAGLATDVLAALAVIARRKVIGTVDLRLARLDGTDLRSAHLLDAYLDRTNLSGADLRDADLRHALLRSANLSGANLSGTYLADADLSDANLSNADLSDAKKLTQEQLGQACGKPKVLPSGLTLDKPCPPQ